MIVGMPPDPTFSPHQGHPKPSLQQHLVLVYASFLSWSAGTGRGSIAALR